MELEKKVCESLTDRENSCKDARNCREIRQGIIWDGIIYDDKDLDEKVSESQRTEREIYQNIKADPAETSTVSTEESRKVEAERSAERDCDSETASIRKEMNPNHVELGLIFCGQNNASDSSEEFKYKPRVVGSIDGRPVREGIVRIEDWNAQIAETWYACPPGHPLSKTAQDIIATYSVEDGETAVKDKEAENRELEKIKSVFKKEKETDVKMKEKTQNVKWKAADIYDYLLRHYKIKCFDGVVHIYNEGRYINLFKDLALEGFMETNEKEITREIGHLEFGNSVLKFLRVSDDIENIHYTDCSRYISFRDYALDFETLSICPHSHTHNAWLYFPFNIAPGVGGECRKFHSYLQNLWSGDEELIQREYEILGWLLSPKIDSRKFLFLYGPGGTGKSQRIKFYRNLFNPKNVTDMAVHTFKNDYMPGYLVGSFLNSCGDLSAEILDDKAVGWIKLFTSGDPVNANMKNRPPFTFIPTAKHIYGANYQLKLKQSDPAFDERVLYLPLMNRITLNEVNANFYEQFDDEIPAIVYRGLCAYSEMLRAHREFSGEEKVRHIVGDVLIMKEDSDGIENFVNEGFLLTYEDEDYIPSRDLFSMFKVLNPQTQIDTSQFIKKLLSHYPDLHSKNKRLDGKQTKVVMGIKRRECI